MESSEPWARFAGTACIFICSCYQYWVLSRSGGAPGMKRSVTERRRRGGAGVWEAEGNEIQPAR